MYVYLFVFSLLSFSPQMSLESLEVSITKKGVKTMFVVQQSFGHSACFIRSASVTSVLRAQYTTILR